MARRWVGDIDDWTGLAAIGSILATAIAVVVVPAVWSADPTRIDLGAVSQAPGPAHPLGTDRLGRDLWVRLLWGGRASLGIALAAAMLVTVVGTGLGAASGYWRGWIGATIDRATDLTLALPTLYVLIALQSVLPSGAGSVVAVIGLTLWTGPARVVRGQVLGLRQQGYVEAAQALGSSGWRTLARHILPNCSGQIRAVFTASLAEALLIESGLSFLGLGVRPPDPSWGNVLMDGIAELLAGSWWMVVFPGLAIFAVVAAVSYLSNRAPSPGRSPVPWTLLPG